MKLHTAIFAAAAILILTNSSAKSASDLPVATNFKVDLTCAEKTIDWLDYINTGSSDSACRQYFLDSVATTDGCKLIIDHWARFKDWDNVIFLDFIFRAMGKLESNEPLKDDKGNLTRFGLRQKLWTAALSNPDSLRLNLKTLDALDPTKKAYKKAKQFLPTNADISNTFYLILFGASTAFSVGDRNGFDLLQTETTITGEIDTDEVIQTFAHEAHHSGFSDITKKTMGAAAQATQLMLAGILVAEGSATYFTSNSINKLKELSESHSSTKRQIAADWVMHLANLDELFASAENDIHLSIVDSISRGEIVESWLSGMQGAAYVLGENMVSTIDKYSGRETSLKLITDYRLLLQLYNEAANKANSQGEALFLFDKELVSKVAKFKVQPSNDKTE